MKMRGRIIFSSPNGFYTYDDDITRQIIPLPKLNAILPYIRECSFCGIPSRNPASPAVRFT